METKNITKKSRFKWPLAVMGGVIVLALVWLLTGRPLTFSTTDALEPMRAQTDHAGLQTLVAGQPVNIPITFSGGQAPYVWKIREGSLPAGLRLENESINSIRITGTPQLPGDSLAILKVRDRHIRGPRTVLALNIKVNPAPSTVNPPPSGGTTGSGTTGSGSTGGGTTGTGSGGNPPPETIPEPEPGIELEGDAPSIGAVTLTLVPWGSGTAPGAETVALVRQFGYDLARYYARESGGQLAVSIAVSEPLAIVPPYTTTCGSIRAAAGTRGADSDYRMFVFAGGGQTSCVSNSIRLGSREAFAAANDINMAHEFGHQLGLPHQDNCGPMSAFNTLYTDIASLPHMCANQKAALGW